MLSYFTTFLKSKTVLVLKEQWIKNPIAGQNSLVFHSPNETSTADFSIEKRFYFQENQEFCYDAFIEKGFDSRESAEKYISQKRTRVHGKIDIASTEPVEFMNISDPDPESEITVAPLPPLAPPVAPIAPVAPVPRSQSLGIANNMSKFLLNAEYFVQLSLLLSCFRL